MSDLDKKPGVGVGVMILKRGKVLLGRRNYDPLRASSALHGEGTWTMPGGKLDFQEELEDCAFREAYEETGIKINKNKLEVISLTNNIVEDAHFVTIGFLCRDFKGEPKVIEPDEIVEWKWFPLKKLPQPIFLPSRGILESYFKKHEGN